MNIKAGNRYQHYKGKTYVVLVLAKHSETLEEVVVYQGEYDDPEFGKNPVWVRPLTMFVESVSVDGKMIPRFTEIQ